MMIHLIAFTVKFTLIFTLRIELDLDISETRFEFSSSSLHSPKKGNQSKLFASNSNTLQQNAIYNLWFIQ